MNNQKVPLVKFKNKKIFFPELRKNSTNFERIGEIRPVGNPAVNNVFEAIKSFQ